MLRTRTVGRARPRPQPLVHAAHLDQRPGAAREPPRRGRRGWRALHRVPVRPAGLDAGATRRLPGRAHPSRPRRGPARALAARSGRRAATRRRSRGTPRDGARHHRPRPTARPPRTGSPAPPRSRRATRPSSTVGSCPPRPGRPSPTSPGATARASPTSPRATVEDVDRAVAGGPHRLRRPALGRPVARRPQARPAQARRAHADEPRRAGTPRIARRREADPRHAGRRRPVRGEDHPVVRRDDRQGLRRRRSDRARRALARHA